jgi:hypothetical protein
MLTDSEFRRRGELFTRDETRDVALCGNLYCNRFSISEDYEAART